MHIYMLPKKVTTAYASRPMSVQSIINKYKIPAGQSPAKSTYRKIKWKKKK